MNLLRPPSDRFAPEAQMALDMARRGALVAPVWIGLFGLVRGWDGAASAGYGLLVVLVNLGLAAILASTFARRSPLALGAATLAGYPVRLALIVAAVFAVRHAGWFDVWALGITIGIAHLGLLIWEARRVSLSFTYPTFAPRTEPSSEGAFGAELQETP